MRREDAGVKHLVSVGSDRRVSVWLEDVEGDVERLRTIEHAHERPITAARFASSLSLIATGARGGALRLWDFENVTLEASLAGHRHDVTSLAVVPGYSLLVSGDAGGDVLVWALRGNDASAGLPGARASSDAAPRASADAAPGGADAGPDGAPEGLRRLRCAGLPYIADATQYPPVR